MGTERDGAVFQQNGKTGAVGPPERRDHSSAEVQPAGQATKDYESWQFVDIRLESSLVEYLRGLGGGDVSEGVRIAAKRYQAESLLKE